jgi:hypothetical protein
VRQGLIITRRQGLQAFSVNDLFGSHDVRGPVHVPAEEALLGPLVIVLEHSIRLLAPLLERLPVRPPLEVLFLRALRPLLFRNFLVRLPRLVDHVNRRAHLFVARRVGQLGAAGLGIVLALLEHLVKPAHGLVFLRELAAVLIPLLGLISLRRLPAESGFWGPSARTIIVPGRSITDPCIGR